MDPFSIATGSAGLVSLGITLCDGLLTYCRSYMSRDSNLNSLNEHAERLKVFLRAIERRFQSGLVADASFRATVVECFGACERCVQDLRALSRKYSQEPETSSLPMRGRSKAALRKLQYPFEVDRFTNLSKQLNDFYSALSGLLLLMNYDLANEIRHNVDSHSKALASVISSHGSELSRQMALMGPSIAHELDRGLTDLEMSIQRQFECLGKQWADSERNQVKSQSAPDKNAAQEKIETQAGRVSPFLFDSLCSCSTNGLGNHQKGCFRSLQLRKVHIISRNLKFFNLLLHFRLEVQRNPFSFARDLRVYPNFSMRATVGNRSPAFGLVYETFSAMERRPAARELQRIFRDCLVGLQKLFEKGKAWPTDITTSGNNLLHYACYGSRVPFVDDTAAMYLQYLKELVTLGVPLNDIEDYHHNTPLSAVMHQSNFCSISLSRSAGSHQASISHESDRLHDDIAKQLMECGAELPGIEETELFGSGGPYFLPVLRRSSITLADEFGYGALSCALIRESELCVRRLLSRSQSHILEKGRNLESPLHVATPWPRGVELLLQLGGDAIETVIDAPNAFGESPLDYALQLGQLSSVQLLVNGNAELDLEATFNIETARMKHWNSPQYDEVIDFLCQTLAERRKRMLCLAIEWLPEHDIARLKLKDQVMLQDNAFEASEALRHQKHHLSPWFHNVQPGSVYHSACMSLSLARTLLTVGFQRPNTNFHGFSPLMTVNLHYLTHRRCLEGTVDLIIWFLDQGANLQSFIPSSGLRGIATETTSHFSDFKAIHRVADVYGEGFYRSHIAADDQLRVNHMRDVIKDASSDPCTCYCTQSGCTPATLFIRSLLNRSGWTSEWTHPQQLDIIHQGLVLLSIFLSSLNDRNHYVAADIIRASTFQRLGMKHTCCTYIDFVWDPEASVSHAILAGEFKVIDIMDPEDVAEIQEEDQHLAVRLEALVEEFTAKYDEESVSFHDFFFGYWWERMDEVEPETDETCRDDLEEI